MTSALPSGATLARPEGRLLAGLVPLHPADEPSREHFLLMHLAETLPPLGIAVLRYDRRPSDGWSDVPLAIQAQDARAAIDELRRSVGRPDLPVGLWGFSQGAWAAALAAKADGTREQLRRAGYAEEEQRELEILRKAFEGYLRGTVSRDEIRGRVRAAVQTILPRRSRPPPAQSWPSSRMTTRGCRSIGVSRSSARPSQAGAGG